MTEHLETDDVRRYYERHTSAFVRYGQGEGSIHRAVWGPGVSSREAAFHYVEERIAELLRQRPQSDELPHLVDLGCGVGASLSYLARRLRVRGTGITLSPTQATLARERIAAEGLSGTVNCFEGDYNALPESVAPADLAYAIEAFVHGPSPARFFEQCRRLIKPDGLLVICDDIRRQVATPAAVATVDQFVRGWHVNALLERNTLIALARDAGFEHQSTEDLTPFLELRRLRDRVVAVALALLQRLPIDMSRYDDLVGGTALQTCLANGWVGYELIVFRRRAS